MASQPKILGFVIDVGKERLIDPAGVSIELRPKSFAVLRYMSENVGRVVTKDELMAAVWPGITVSDDSLVQCVGDIRQALGEVGHAILKTVPRRGYMLAATPGGRAATLPSVAVLPFESLDNDDRTARFADGLTDNIITDIARHPDIFVIARHSVLPYKGQAISTQEVGRDLGVRYVLSGTLQMSVERVRVAAQLIEVETSTNVWAERYDRPHGDVFQMQDDLTRAIVNRIVGVSGQLVVAERNLARRKEPQSLEAYDLYVLGTNMADLFTREGTRAAIGYLERAVRMDPNFARAWTALSAMHLIDASSGYAEDLAIALTTYVAAAKRAVELEPNDCRAQAMVAGAYFREGELSKGKASYERALALGPNDADTLANIAYTRPTKLPTAEEDVALARRAMDLNPLYPDWYSMAFGYSSYYARHFEDVIGAFSRADIADMHLYLALSHGQLGHTIESARHREKLLALIPDFSAQGIIEGDAMCDPAAIELFLDGVEKARLPK
jgi:TolB-like protein